MDGSSSALLVAGDPEPVAVENLGGSSPLLLLGDHAGRSIPTQLGDLGLQPSDLVRHIGWDIGIEGLGLDLAGRLDACFIRQRYSRLVIDCNRDPSNPGSIAGVSDGVMIDGNQGINERARRARFEAIFSPYHTRIRQILNERKAQGRPTILAALHSFTPQLNGGDLRPWRFGVLHRHDSPFSDVVLAELKARWGDEAADNQPYAMDGNDYTIPAHADPRGLDYLELEVRQNLLTTPEQPSEMGAILAPVLDLALKSLREPTAIW